MTLDEKIRLDFVVLGAQKAGTTTLHNWLSSHPKIALPIFKETHFFSHKNIRAHGMQWYLQQFPDANDGTLIGEVDPEYLFAPSAPTEIASKTTANKFIVLLRHPLERALSQYLMSFRRGYERKSFADALSLENTRLSDDPDGFAADNQSYTVRSLYTDQIARFQDAFPTGKFLFQRSDSLDEHGYRRICEFIGVEPAVENINFEARSNTASGVRSSFLRDALYAPDGKSALRRLLVKAIPASAKRQIFLTIDRANQKGLDDDRAAMMATAADAVLRAMLDDLGRLEPVVGLDLADWRSDIERRLKP